MKRSFQNSTVSHTHTCSKEEFASDVTATSLAPVLAEITGKPPGEAMAQVADLIEVDAGRESVSVQDDEGGGWRLWSAGSR
jgi:hypothetical protein